MCGPHQVWPLRSECCGRGVPTKVVCAECMKMCCLGGKNSVVKGLTSICFLISPFSSSCGLHDPSWAKIRHFVEFLNIQLLSCDGSLFSDEAFVGDVMPGLKGVVVKLYVMVNKLCMSLASVVMSQRQSVEHCDVTLMQIGR